MSARGIHRWIGWQEWIAPSHVNGGVKVGGPRGDSDAGGSDEPLARHYSRRGYSLSTGERRWVVPYGPAARMLTYHAAQTIAVLANDGDLTVRRRAIGEVIFGAGAVAPAWPNRRAARGADR